MIDNKEKRWFGCYSQAGRNSVGRYPSIIHKNEIFSAETKKVITKDFFAPDEPGKYTFLSKDIDIYKEYDIKSKEVLERDYELKHDSKGSQDEQKDIKSILLQHFNNKSVSDIRRRIQPKSERGMSEDKFRYHNKTEKKLKTTRENPKSPKDFRISYTPKMEYIWSKIITGPKWRKSKGVRKTVFDIDVIDCKDYYQAGMLNTLSTRSLVNMDLQTMRGFFAGNKDVRIRNDKVYQATSEENKPQANSTSRTKRTTHPSTKKRNDTNSTNNSQLISKTMYSSPNMFLTRGVNFKTMMSREQVDRAKDIGRFNEKLDSLDPNYSLVRDRTITMVLYDQHKKNANSRKINLREKIGVDPSRYYDATQTYNKIHINPGANVPNFNLMCSRPINADPLPSYMKKLYNRAAVNVTTDKTLLLNNFAEGQFLQATTSFRQKKGYNYPIPKRNRNDIHRLIAQTLSANSRQSHRVEDTAKTADV